MPMFLHKTLPRLTALSAEELGDFLYSKLRVSDKNFSEGYCTLTVVEYSKALQHGARTIDDVSFENLAKAMNAEVEI